MLTLLIDANYLCHRAFHTTGHLHSDGEPTGVIYGVLRTVEAEIDLLNPDRVVFAFDCIGPTLRQVVSPGYKASRRRKREEETDEERLESWKKLGGQIQDLYQFVLRELGYANVFRRNGYEADDIIAAIAGGTTYDDQAVILSSDKDMWQCIRENVWCKNPTTGKTLGLKAFREEWGIDPSVWATVKAIAGCGTDDVDGIPGVGEKTAAKWMRGELKSTTKAFQKINAGLGDITAKNIQLVTLPYPGMVCADFLLLADETTRDKRTDMYQRLGFKPERPRRGKSNRRKGKVGFGLNQ